MSIKTFISSLFNSIISKIIATVIIPVLTTIIVDLIKKYPLFSTIIHILKYRISLWLFLLLVIFIVIACFYIYKKKLSKLYEIERYEYLFITLKNDREKIKYCSCCYDTNAKFVQIQTAETTGRFSCPSCKTSGIFDKKRNNSYNITINKQRFFRNLNARQNGIDC